MTLDFSFCFFFFPSAGIQPLTPLPHALSRVTSNLRPVAGTLVCSALSLVDGEVNKVFSLPAPADQCLALRQSLGKQDLNR